MVEKGVMITRSSKQQIPAQASSAQVAAFIRDRGFPPAIDNVAIDWKSSLKSSPWNQETIRLLVIDFQTKIKAGTYPTIVYDDKTMHANALSSICTQKLSRTLQACRQKAAIEASSNEQREDAISKQNAARAAQLKNDRSTARKHGVRCKLSYGYLLSPP